MCGIVGYIGNKPALPLILDGLKRLEYRGYDSAGIVAPSREGLFSLKRAGRVADLEQKFLQSPDAARHDQVAIGHTRWATHGAPTDNNAHPHLDCKNRICVVHNGIIENYAILRQELSASGHRFRSETDTEVLAHLIEEYFKEDLGEAVRKALTKVHGTWGIAVVSADEPTKIIAARFSSPLLLGLGDKEYFVASDASAVLRHTNKVLYLEDGDIATITPDGYTVQNLMAEILSREPQILEWSQEEAERGGYSHFMLKEIFEEPQAIENALRGRIDFENARVKFGGLEELAAQIRGANRIIFTACGTAYYAALVGEYMIEELAKIPVEVEYASEFRYRQPVLNDDTILVAVSQSGETADTLAAVREAKRQGILTLGIINVVGSTIAREVEAGIYNHAGPEIGVASTKAFISQLTVLALFALSLARERGMAEAEARVFLEELARLPGKVNAILAWSEHIEDIAKKYKDAKDFLYIGRKYNFPIALEGALKLKEISYIHAEGYAAGEMKHGPIALIDKEFPTIAIAPHNSVYEKVISNMEEILARRGPIIGIGTKGDKKLERLTNDIIWIPKTIELFEPILSVVPLQLFAYYVGVLRGCDVDKPRNLAKSVTVE